MFKLKRVHLLTRSTTTYFHQPLDEHSLSRSLSRNMDLKSILSFWPDAHTLRCILCLLVSSEVRRRSCLAVF